MKKLITLALLALTLIPAAAQQQIEHRRSESPFVFPEFREAKVLQTFGRSVKANVNIYLKDATLFFTEGETMKRAFTQNILGVEFDSVKYMKVDSVMGEVLASDHYNHLVRVTTIDMERYKEETQGGINLPFFEIGGNTTTGFFEIDGQNYDEKGYPLKERYYFLVKGEVVPANETKFRKHVRPAMMLAFKNLMNERFWSWNDPESLKQLLKYLPE